LERIHDEGDFKTTNTVPPGGFFYPLEAFMVHGLEIKLSETSEKGG
jgi:hypothetical protein